MRWKERFEPTSARMPKQPSRGVVRGLHLPAHAPEEHEQLPDGFRDGTAPDGPCELLVARGEEGDGVVPTHDRRAKRQVAGEELRFAQLPRMRRARVLLYLPGLHAETHEPDA